MVIRPPYRHKCTHKRTRRRLPPDTAALVSWAHSERAALSDGPASFVVKMLDGSDLACIPRMPHHNRPLIQRHGDVPE